VTLDLTTRDGAHALARLRTELAIWFTSVSSSGQPQSFPVWFLWDDGDVIVYSLNSAKRNENIEARPKVSLHLEGGAHGEDLVILEGEARIDPDLPPASDEPRYVAKYAPSLARMAWTPEHFSSLYDVRIRVHPTRIRVSGS
jgi:PPOX class probable F420-dependent enzyme